MRISQVFVAATPIAFGVFGSFFRIRTAAAGIDVTFFRGEKKLQENLVSATAAEWAYPEGGFDKVVVTSSAGQLVEFDIYAGRVGSDAVSGSVSIIGAPDVNVTDRAARLLGVIYGTLGQAAQVLIGGVNALASYCYGTLGALAQVAIGGVNALQVTTRGISYGAAFSSTAAMAANTSATVFTPAANVNGAIVWRAGAHSFNASQFGQLSLIAHTAAPNSPTVGDVIGMQTAAAESGTDRVLILSLSDPVFIPAGKGLYFNVTIAETANNYRHAVYTLL